MDKFFEWVDLQKYSKSHYIHIRSYFKKHLNNRTFKDPFALQKYIFRRQAGIVSIVKTARTYLRYCELFNHLPTALISRYRSILILKDSKKDFFVPPDSDVLANYKLVRKHASLNIVYLVLATSGIRFTECLAFLKSYDGSRFKVSSNFVSYPVSELRNTKNINNIYMPRFVFERLRQVTNTYQMLRTKYNARHPSFSLKYLRKWHYNFLLYNGMPESVADFIQGRAGKAEKIREALR